jgi:hypothetical protein
MEKNTNGVLDNILDNFLHLRQSINAIILGQQLLEHLHLTQHDWFMLERYKALFEIFNIPTIALQGEFFPTLFYIRKID